MGREEGPGLLTWPFVAGSLFGSLSSPDTAVAATDSRARLATDFFLAPVCLDSLAPPGTKAYFWDLPGSGMPGRRISERPVVRHVWAVTRQALVMSLFPWPNEIRCHLGASHWKWWVTSPKNRQQGF